MEGRDEKERAEYDVAKREEREALERSCVWGIALVLICWPLLRVVVLTECGSKKCTRRWLAPCQFSSPR